MGKKAAVECKSNLEPTELPAGDAPGESRNPWVGDPGRAPATPAPTQLAPRRPQLELRAHSGTAAPAQGLRGSADTICPSRGVRLLALHLLLLANGLQAYGEISQTFPTLGDPREYDLTCEKF